MEGEIIAIVSDSRIIAGTHNSAKMWITYSEYTLSKKPLPRKLIECGNADMTVLSQKIGKCSTWDTFTVSPLLRWQVFPRYHL